MKEERKNDKIYFSFMFFRKGRKPKIKTMVFETQVSPKEGSQSLNS